MKSVGVRHKNHYRPSEQKKNAFAGLDVQGMCNMKRFKGTMLHQAFYRGFIMFHSSFIIRGWLEASEVEDGPILPRQTECGSLWCCANKALRGFTRNRWLLWMGTDLLWCLTFDTVKCKQTSKSTWYFHNICCFMSIGFYWGVLGCLFRWLASLCASPATGRLLQDAMHPCDLPIVICCDHTMAHPTLASCCIMRSPDSRKGRCEVWIQWKFSGIF